MQKIRILLIDDQPDFLEPIAFWMRSKGCEVSTATEGRQGIDLVHTVPFDLVFVDFKMPGMNGLEVIREIRTFNKTVPIIILTAHASDVMLQNTQDLDLSGLFPKMAPFEDLEQMLQVILKNLSRAKA